MFMKLKKDTLKNKQLVSNLNKRMFLGYTTLKNLNNKKNNKTFTLYNPKKNIYHLNMNINLCTKINI
jgi:hypothetical protein